MTAALAFLLLAALLGKAIHKWHLREQGKSLVYREGSLLQRHTESARPKAEQPSQSDITQYQQLEALWSRRARERA